MTGSTDNRAPSGRRTVAAEREVAAPPPEVFAFLCDLRNHWELTGRWVSLEGLNGPARDPSGGTVLLRGPLGLRRHAHTQVVHSDPDRLLRGRARVGRRTEAEVRWTLHSNGGGTRVTLEAELLRAGIVDRALMAVLRPWLARRFADTIGRLDAVLSKAR